MSTCILGLDTATPEVAVAVTRGTGCVGERQLPPVEGERPRHATALLPAIDELVAEAGGWSSVGQIAVGVGPGSFTGLRIGIATARALAQGRGLPLAGVGSLAALARGIGERDDRTRGSGLAVIDARRGEAFALLVSINGDPLLGPVVEPPDRLVSLITEEHRPVLAAGDGALRFRQELEAGEVEVLPEAALAHRLSARHVCALAGDPRAALTEVQPVYLRQPDAKLWRERDLGNP